MQCAGNEDRLVDCPSPDFGVVDCASNRAVEVACMREDPDPLPEQGQIRFGFVRSETATRVRGLIEVFNDGLWGRVCDDNFDVFDASVACRQLGFSPIGKHFPFMQFFTHLILLTAFFTSRLQIHSSIPTLLWI